MLSNDFLHLMQMMAEPVLLTTAEGVIVTANRALAVQLDIDCDTLAGQNLTDLVSDAPQAVLQSLRTCSRSSQPVIGAMNFRRGEGAAVKFRYRGSLLRARQEEQPALVLMRSSPQLNESSGFTLLNDKIRQLTKEIRQRMRVEADLRRAVQQADVASSC